MILAFNCRLKLKEIVPDAVFIRSYRAYFRQRAAGAATFAATVQESAGGKEWGRVYGVIRYLLELSTEIHRLALKIEARRLKET